MVYIVFSQRRWVWVWVWVYVVCCGFSFTVVEDGVVLIDDAIKISSTDEDFICATLDWWPPEKCDYGKCSWGYASLLNVDLNNSIFFNAVKAFSPLKIRLGGTLQNKVFYQTTHNNRKCVPFKKNALEMFGFTKGCLSLRRWDELNLFFAKSGALVIFGLNALRGKTIYNNKATGLWHSMNAASLIQYTIEKGYNNIFGWELGNELSGDDEIGVEIDVVEYAYDTIALHQLIKDLYMNVTMKTPLVMAPGGFFNKNWYTQFIDKTVGSLNVITHHIYNVGAGNDRDVLGRILNPSALNNESHVFKELRDAIYFSRNPAVVSWVGEGGGVWKSGRENVTNKFVFGFWYLDQLGQASIYGTRTYCRQSLIGGNYGLLDTNTFVPNPDYYSALLWHKLMGPGVLWVEYNGTKMIRAYAHCAKKS
ncbi:Heparanase-like protein 3, partial [Striga hermonthica]